MKTLHVKVPVITAITLVAADPLATARSNSGNRVPAIYRPVHIDREWILNTLSIARSDDVYDHSLAPSVLDIYL